MRNRLVTRFDEGKDLSEKLGCWTLRCKRWFTIIAVAIASCTFADMEVKNGYTWTFEIAEYEDEAYPYSVSPTPTGAIVIPDSLGGKPVTRFSGFSGCSGLTSVTIPDSVTSIGYDAFSGCSGLTSVTIPDSVTRIGPYAFYFCGFTSVTIPNSVTDIGDHAFAGCNSLTSVTIPKSVTNIQDSAFSGCVSLASVAIPNSVTDIKTRTFEACGLTSVAIPNSVTSIGDYAFHSCVRLTSVTIPASVTSIGDNAFSDCFRLTSVAIPNSVTDIKTRTFEHCGLTSVTIPNSVTNIGNCAFSDCDLTNVTISASVTHIEGSAFASCSYLESFEVAVGNRHFMAIDGVLYSKDRSVIVCMPGGVTGDFTIPDFVTSIGDYAFYACRGLTSVTIPDSVTSIGENAFHGLWDWTSVAIPNSVTSIGDNAFESCSGLTNVTIPDSVTSIGDRAFSWCSGLTSVAIPSSVTSIGYGAFQGCYGLQTAFVPIALVDDISKFYVFDSCPDVNIVFYCGDMPPIDDIDQITIMFDGAGGELAAISVKASAERPVGALPAPNRHGFLFEGWFTAAEGGEKVTQITTFDSDVTLYAHWVVSGTDYTIQHGVLVGVVLNGATEIAIPDGVSSIADRLFYNWNGAYNGLASVTIPHGVESIGEQAFLYCSGLTEIIIPNSVIKIGYGAFDGCSGLTSVTVPGSVEVIGFLTFNNCNGLASVTIDNGVKNIGDCAFYGCSRLTSVTIPDSVTNIGARAFYGCAALESVTIGNGVKSIGMYAFYGCSALKIALVPKALESSIVANDVFEECPNVNVIFYEGDTPSIDDIKQITITFDGNGGELTEMSREVVSGYPVGDLPAARKDGFAFVGWFTTMGVGEKVVSQSVFDQNMTLYAHWRKFEAEMPTSFGGNANWVQEADGIWRSGSISHSRKTSVLLSVNGPGTLAFSWKTSSEHYFDKLHFYINDVEVVPAISGEMSDWAFVEYEVANSGMVDVKWEYTKDASGSSGSDCGWIKDIAWASSSDLSVVPAVDGDEGAVVTGDAENGFVVKPSDGKKDVVVIVPEGVEPTKITVEVASTVDAIKANGATVKVMKGGHDIAEHLDLEAVTQDGVINLASAKVKEEVVREALDTEKGATVSLGDTESPSLTTSETKPGLTYTLCEGRMLEGMVDGDSTIGDGEKWTPTITVKGGTSGFYTIKVEK